MCSVDSCTRIHYAKSFCLMHYYRWKVRGDPNDAGTKGCCEIEHGMTNTKFFSVWQGMKARCNTRTNKAYARYGGRGITVCEKWQTFKNFMEDMYASYLDHKKNNECTTIERVDNDRGYAPENCKWATCTEQSRNRSYSIWITMNGEKKHICEWAEITGIGRGTIASRIKAGWEEKDLLNPVKKVSKPSE